MRSADIVLYIFDVNTETSTDLQQQVKIFKEASIKYLLVGNKVDGELNEHFSKYDETADVHFISAKNHIGLPELKTLLFDRTVQGSPESEDRIITNARHYEALPEVQKSACPLMLTRHYLLLIKTTPSFISAASSWIVFVINNSFSCFLIGLY